MGCFLYLVPAPVGAASTFSLMVYSLGLLQPGKGLRVGSRCTQHFPQTHSLVPSVATGLLLPLAVSELVLPTVCRGLCPSLFVDGPALLPPWHPGWCLVSPSRCLSGLLAGYCLRGTRVGCPLLRTPAASLPTPLAWMSAFNPPGTWGTVGLQRATPRPPVDTGAQPESRSCCPVPTDPSLSERHSSCIVEFGYLVWFPSRASHCGRSASHCLLSSCPLPACLCVYSICSLQRSTVCCGVANEIRLLSSSILVVFYNPGRAPQFCSVCVLAFPRLLRALTAGNGHSILSAGYTCSVCCGPFLGTNDT